jgi:MFS family permease
VSNPTVTGDIAPLMPGESRSLRPFVFTQIASIASVISMSMVFISLPWLALDLTGSAASAGLVVSISAIPGLILSPVMGSFIDKFGRRRIAIWVELLTMLTSVMIPIFAGLWEMSLVMLIIIALLRGVVSPAGPTSRKSLVPDVARVARLTLDRANSIHEAVFASGFAIGPALAAILIGFFGVINTFWVIGFFGLVSGLAALGIKVKELHEEGDPDENLPFYIYAVQGFKILFHTPSVLILMAAILTLALIYLPTEMVLLPAHYNKTENPGTLGAIISAMAFASVFGALFFERIHRYLSFANILRIGILGVPLAMLPMSMLPDPWAMVVFGLVLGGAWGPLMPLLNTVIQTKIPANKRGRVFSLEMTIWSAGPMISTVFAGLAVDSFGVGPVYLSLALAVLLAGILVATSKSIKDLDRP